MFTMMNSARLNVGLQGVGVAEAALQKAVAYAADRNQMGPIINHPDVRRMLAVARAEVFAARAIGLACATAIDLERATGDPLHAARAAFLTPIAKAYGTDVGCRVADIGVQVHGGMGYVEETGAAQYLRDVRITPIYEGTNGIQAMDLVGRKLSDGGDAALRLLEEIADGAKAAQGDHPQMANQLWQAAETLREATHTLLDRDLPVRFAGAVPYLTAFARVLGGLYHLRAAQAGGAAHLARAMTSVLAQSERRLELILADLREAGFLLSHRGKMGGYLLAKPPHLVSMGEIIRVIEGPLALVPCVSRTAYRRCADCKSEADCAIRHAMMRVRSS